MDMEIRFVFATGGREGNGMGWGLGVSRYKLLGSERVSNEILLYSMGNYIQSLVMEHYGGSCEKKNIYVYTHTHTHVYMYIYIYMTGPLFCIAKIDRTLKINYIRKNKNLKRINKNQKVKKKNKNKKKPPMLEHLPEIICPTTSNSHLYTW